MASDMESGSESSYNFGYKIQLDQNRKTFNRDDGFNFEDFGFVDTKTQEARGNTDGSVTNSRSGSKIRSEKLHAQIQDGTQQMTAHFIPSKTLLKRKSATQNIKDQSQKSLPSVSISSCPPNPIVASTSVSLKPLEDNEVDKIRQQIEYYTKQGQLLEFQTSKLKEKGVQIIRAHESLDRRIELSCDQVLELNNRIAELTAHQESLQKAYNLTKAESNNLIWELGMPTTVGEVSTQEERRLVNELQAIERQFRDINQQNVTLELSLKPQSDINPAKAQPIETSYTELLSNLNTLGSDCSKHLFNIKMCCLKQRWVLYQNEDLQLGLVYDTSSYETVSVVLHLGNKLGSQIGGIVIGSDKQQILNVVSMKGNNFVEASKTVDVPSFHYVSLTYLKKTEETVQKLAIPFGWMKFGDFEVVTLQGFFKLWKEREGEIKSEKCPVDSDIVSEINDFKKYFPNLVKIPHKNGHQWAGLYKVDRGEFRGTKLLVKFRLYQETYQVVIGKTRNTVEVRDKLLQHFCFLFSV